MLFNMKKISFVISQIIGNKTKKNKANYKFCFIVANNNQNKKKSKEWVNIHLHRLKVYLKDNLKYRQ